MKQAVADWKSRQAGDDDAASEFATPTAAEQDLKVVTLGYVRRRAWCSGGEYVVRLRDVNDEREGHGAKDTPIIAKTRECRGEVVYPTDLCQDCARRERHVRETLRAAEAKSNGALVQTANRSKWTR